MARNTNCIFFCQSPFFAHFGSSFFNDSICVSSEKMADICVQNMTTVKMPNSKDSNPSRITKIRVEVGEKLEHSFGSNNSNKNAFHAEIACSIYKYLLT